MQWVKKIQWIKYFFEKSFKSIHKFYLLYNLICGIDKEPIPKNHQLHYRIPYLLNIDRGSPPANTLPWFRIHDMGNKIDVKVNWTCLHWTMCPRWRACTVYHLYQCTSVPVPGPRPGWWRWVVTRSGLVYTWYWSAGQRSLRLYTSH